MLEKINQDIKTALREKQAERLLVLRGILSEIKNEHIKIGKDKKISDELVVAVLAREAKKRKDAIMFYQQGGRPDKVEAEKRELQIIQAYLPKQLSGEELESIINQAIKKTCAQGLQDIGKLMGYLMKRIKGRADGSKVKQIAKKLLSK